MFRLYRRQIKFELATTGVWQTGGVSIKVSSPSVRLFEVSIHSPPITHILIYTVRHIHTYCTVTSTTYDVNIVNATTWMAIINGSSNMEIRDGTTQPGACSRCAVCNEMLNFVVFLVFLSPNDQFFNTENW